MSAEFESHICHQQQQHRCIRAFLAGREAILGSLCARCKKRDIDSMLIGCCIPSLFARYLRKVSDLEVLLGVLEASRDFPDRCSNVLDVLSGR
jgi:hypothetical protein